MTRPGRARCPHCGVLAAGPAAAALAAELDILWLEPPPAEQPGTTGDHRVSAPVREMRHCRRCAPRDTTIAEIVCAVCGDGPLLTGTLAHQPADPIAAKVTAWLLAHHWRHDTRPGGGGWYCPGCPAPHTVRQAYEGRARSRRGRPATAPAMRRRGA